MRLFVESRRRRFGPIRERKAWLPLPRLRADTSGATILEFALLFPIFCFVLLAIFEGGLYGGAYLSLRNAAYEGAHVGRFPGEPDAAIRNAVQAHAGMLRIQAGDIIINPANSRVAGGTVALTVAYSFQPIPIPGTSWGSTPIPLMVRATAQVE